MSINVRDPFILCKHIVPLAGFLFHHQEKNVAIPLIAGKKQPVRGANYKGSSWTWQEFEACSHKLMRKGDTFDIGILARSLLVLDADNKEMMDFLEATFPVPRTVPMETTAKGAHYIMLQSPLCDQLVMYDKADCFLNVNSEDPMQSLQLDLKTVSTSEPYRDGCKTPGLITVSPSVEKEWIRPLWETPRTEVSDEMAEQLAVTYQAR